MGIFLEQDLTIVILPPKEKDDFFHPSSLFEIFLMIGPQKSFFLGVAPKGNPKYSIGKFTTLQLAEKAKSHNSLVAILLELSQCLIL